jgi:hypothetical protein
MMLSDNHRSNRLIIFAPDPDVEAVKIQSTMATINTSQAIAAARQQ